MKKPTKRLLKILSVVLALLVITALSLVIFSFADQPNGEQIDLTFNDIVEVDPTVKTPFFGGNNGRPCMLMASDSAASWESSDPNSNKYGGKFLTIDLGAYYDLTELRITFGVNYTNTRPVAVYAAAELSALAGLTDDAASLASPYLLYTKVYNSTSESDRGNRERTITSSEFVGSYQSVRYIKIYKTTENMRGFKAYGRKVADADVSRLRVTSDNVFESGGTDVNQVFNNSPDAYNGFQVNGNNFITVDLGDKYYIHEVQLLLFDVGGNGEMQPVNIYGGTNPANLNTLLGTYTYNNEPSLEWAKVACNQDAQVRFLKIAPEPNSGKRYVRLREVKLYGKLAEKLSRYTITVVDGDAVQRIDAVRGDTLGMHLSGTPTPSDPNDVFIGWKSGNAFLNSGEEIKGDLTIKATYAKRVNLTTDMILTTMDFGRKESLVSGTKSYTFQSSDNNGTVMIDLGAYYKEVYIRLERSNTVGDLQVQYGKNLNSLSSTYFYQGSVDGGGATKKGVHTLSLGGSEIRYISLSHTSIPASINNFVVGGTFARDLEKYTIHFDVNGGQTKIDPITEIVEGMTLSALPGDPYREGYSFIGWYTESSLKNIFDVSTPITRNMTVYAKWLPANGAPRYDIQFETNGGSACATLKELPANSTVANLPVPTKNGYIFLGWYSDQTLQTAFTPETKIKRNMILYAKYEKITAADPLIPTSTSSFQDPAMLGKNLFDKSLTSGWTGYNSRDYTIVIDLGKTYRVTELWSYVTGNGDISFYGGLSEKGDDQTLIYKYKTAGNKLKPELDIGKIIAPVRYITVVRSSSSGIAELFLFGQQVPDTDPILGKITDLVCENVKSEDSDNDPYVQLTWSAPTISGVGSYTGAADAYDIRYSKSPITKDNWNSATRLTADDFIEGDAGIPIPMRAGTKQSVRVYDLDPETTYYFAVRSLTNWRKLVYSDLSNVVNKKTEEDSVLPGSVLLVNDDPTAGKYCVIGSTRVQFTFTAPGDNGNRGTAVSYDVRISTDVIENNNDAKEAAPKAPSGSVIPAPAKAGTTQKISVRGLKPQTTYYITVGTTDKGGNQSWSGVIEFTTKELDASPPGTPYDLQVQTGSGGALLSFTAPGGNGWSGKVLEYEIRYIEAPYGTNALTNANWASATKVDTTDMEVVDALEIQEYVINGLQPGKFYYIGVKGVDQEGNVSPGLNTFMYVQGEKLTHIERDNVYAEFPNGKFYMMFDEVNICDPGDPSIDWSSQPQLQAPTNIWTKQYFNLIEEYDEQGIIFDFGAKYYITDIYVYGSTGKGGFDINIGQPFTEDFEIENKIGSYESPWGWGHYAIGVQTQYLRLTMSEELGGKWPTEIIFYGVKVGSGLTWGETKTRDTKTTSVDELMGTNVFIDDFLDYMTCVGNIRDYMNWRWFTGNPTLYPDNVYSFNPAAAGPNVIGSIWYYDDHFASLKRAGIHTMACIQAGFSNGWLGYYDEYGNVHRNASQGHVAMADADWEDPQSYYMHADSMFQMAARWGTTKVDDDLLKLKSNQNRVTGLGVVDVLEIGNEINQTWSSRIGYYTPFEHAALLSADYDGHCGTMGQTMGAKNADPNMQVAMAGLAGLHYDYVRSMYFWFKMNRPDHKAAMDLLNFHVYTTTGGIEQYGSTQAQGQSVDQNKFSEGENVYNVTQQLVHLQSICFPNTMLNLGEFGWDYNEMSTHASKSRGSLDSKTVSAIWMARGFMLFDAWGWEYVQHYMVRDAGDSGDSGVYATCGLVTKPESSSNPTYVQSRLPAYYYTYTLKNALRGYYFDRFIDVGDPTVTVIKYKNDEGKVTYALWHNTEIDKRTSDYQFKVDVGTRVFTMTNMVDLSTVGELTEVYAKDGVVTIDWLTEVPVFLTEGYANLIEAPKWDEDETGSYEVLDQIDQKYVERAEELTTVRLSWSKPETDLDIAYYTIYKDDRRYASINGDQEYFDLTLIESDFADITIKAADINGRETEELLKINIPVDFTPPSKPRNIEIFGVTDTEVSLRWDAASDNRTVEGNISYRVYEADNVVASGPATALTVANLKPQSTHEFYVKSVDAAGNESESSKVMKVTVAMSANPIGWIIAVCVLGAALLGLGGFFGIRYLKRRKQAKALFDEIPEGELAEGAAIGEAGLEGTDATDPAAPEAEGEAEAPEAETPEAETPEAETPEAEAPQEEQEPPQE